MLLYFGLTGKCLAKRICEKEINTFWSKYTHGSDKKDIHMRLSSKLPRLHGWAYILETYVKTSKLIQSNVWIISDQRAIQFYRCFRLHINHQRICPKKTNTLKLKTMNLHASWAILMMCQIFLGMSTTSLTFTAKSSVVREIKLEKELCIVLLVCFFWVKAITRKP